MRIDLWKEDAQKATQSIWETEPLETFRFSIRKILPKDYVSAKWGSFYPQALQVSELRLVVMGL